MFNFDRLTLGNCRFISIQYFLRNFFAQSIHAFSFGLFHIIAMRVIFQNFSAGQQGRGQALYSTMWGLGVALGVFWQGIIGILFQANGFLFLQDYLHCWSCVLFGDCQSN